MTRLLGKITSRIGTKENNRFVSLTPLPLLRVDMETITPQRQFRDAVRSRAGIENLIRVVSLSTGSRLSHNSSPRDQRALLLSTVQVRASDRTHFIAGQYENSSR